MPTGVYDREKIKAYGPQGRDPGSRKRIKRLREDLDELIASVAQSEEEISNKKKSINFIKASLHFLITGENKEF